LNANMLEFEKAIVNNNLIYQNNIKVILMRSAINEILGYWRFKKVRK